MALKNGDFVRVWTRGVCFGQRIILTHNYLIVGDFPVANSIATDLELILTAWAPAGVLDATTPYLACLPPQFSLQEIRAQLFSPTRSAYRSVLFVGGAPGTNAGAATVANDSGCITMRTEKAGRSQVANQHIGPAPDAASAAGVLTAAYTATLATLGSKLVQAFVPPTSGSLVVPVIFHRATATSDTINQFIIGPQSRVQRRRTVGIGE